MLLSKLVPPFRRVSLTTVQVRRSGHLIPPNQYDVHMPFPNKFRLGYAVTRYWEIIPLFFVTGVAMAFVVCSTINLCINKVDVVLTANNRNNISRTMDLRHPTVHKLVIINQKYDPWPEMQDVLDKMKAAEKKMALRATVCNYNTSHS